MTNPFIDPFVNFFGAIDDARRAQRNYHRLSVMNDAELARRGIKRAEIAAAAFRMKNI